LMSVTWEGILTIFLACVDGEIKSSEVSVVPAVWCLARPSGKCDRSHVAF
jgi:hypothetical protein